MGRGTQAPQKAVRIVHVLRRWLLLCVVLAFAATCALTRYFLTRLANTTTDSTLALNLQDVCHDIQDVSNAHLLSLGHEIAAALPEPAGDADLAALAEAHDVAEIDLIGADGVITASSDPTLVGFDMASGAQSAAFLPLLDGEQQMVQDYQPSARDPAVWRKYAGVALPGGGFLQIAYDAAHFQHEISGRVANAAKNRHIGQDGCIVVCDANWQVVSDRDGHEGETMPVLDLPQKERFTLTHHGVTAYAMYTMCEGYAILAILPVREAMAARDAAVLILAFMEILVFAALFTQIAYLMRRLVVENVQRVNGALAKITGGDLSVTVDVRGNEEFSQLSDGINATVTALKHYIDEEAARLDQELELARRIQRSALPSVFPPYPNRRDFSVYAMMDPAREVGGDFYDFDLLSGSRLVFLVADVSGKGIPAALFMMTAKTLLKGYAESGLPAEAVFARTNAALCANNAAQMFCTCWMGVLDLRSGRLDFVNAGHNPPLLCRQGGSFAFLKTKPNFVLAGLPETVYTCQTLTLAAGDTLLLYTDGVTEAHNAAGQLFGNERLLALLEGAADLPPEALCRRVRGGVDAFVAGAEAFDDITILGLQYHGPQTPGV